MLTLEEICQRALIKCKHFIGDIGDIPLELLGPVLRKCDSRDLLRIEEETRLGGRTLDQDDLQQYWKAVFIEDFACGDSAKALAYAGVNTCQFVSWKLAYRKRQDELDAKRERVATKLRDMWQQEEVRKAARTVKVIDKVPAVRSSRLAVRSPPVVNSTRARLARKLHIRPPRAAAGPVQKRIKIQQPKACPSQSTSLLECDIDWMRKSTNEKSASPKTSRELVPTSELRGDQAIIAACNAAKLVEVNIDWS